MTVAYLDPYKDDPYGKLKGDKADCWFKINFDEARLYPIDTGYILAGFVTGYAGVVRSFKASEPLTPGLCAIPIYNKEYEIRGKDKDNQWQSVKYQPSIAEAAICELIDTHKSTYLVDGLGIGGELSFSPDAQLQSFDQAMLKQFIKDSSRIETVTLTGKLPEYTPASSNGQKKGWSGSRGASLDEKLEFIKKELISSVAATGFTTENSLGVLTQQMILEHRDDERFLEIYFDMLMAIAR
ncbi:MAG: hypothetical protein ACRC2S_10510 [Waterburya sp.]